MFRFGKVFLRVFSIVAAVAGVLSVIYFWNLDQKLMDWAYKYGNALFDRKKRCTDGE